MGSGSHKSIQPTLFYIHIPKTAGSSMYQILHQVYGCQLGVVADPDTTIWDTILAQPDHGLACIFGHYWFGLHHSSVLPFEYATMMRDPVEAILSYYYYIARQPSHWLYGHALSLSIEDFFDLPEEVVGMFFRDYQTASILGSSSVSVKKAKQQINSFYPIVGITEMFHESVYMLKKRYGWGPLQVYSVNVTPNRPTREGLAPKVIKQIEALVSHDIQVYAFAKKRLLKSIRSLPPHEKELIQQFKLTGALT
ncbi:hypothetical protein KCTCHS21_10230 [Cohnella abietis]|uniref:Sulfotransferase family protein n=2 Tax=Cohnella abietis TaxID=2507935 RepID=A0A3T1D0K9_9BACL|nr:hypothetical protein KCTCHS21_10230 [Cohnella abietis]